MHAALAVGLFGLVLIHKNKTDPDGERVSITVGSSMVAFSMNALLLGLTRKGDQ